jgi:hypothetical protein
MGIQPYLAYTHSSLAFGSACCVAPGSAPGTLCARKGWWVSLCSTHPTLLSQAPGGVKG